MSPEKKKQRRCDLLTTIALFLGLVFTCRLWPLLLLMMLGVFTYAIWALVENERQRAVPSPPPLLALPAPISEQELISNAFGLLQRRITEELTRDFPRAKWVWGQTAPASVSPPVMTSSSCWPTPRGDAALRCAQTSCNSVSCSTIIPASAY